MKSPVREAFQQKRPSFTKDLNNNSLVYTSELHTTLDSRWSQIKISGKNIPGRSSHAAVIFNNTLYVHGGYNPDQGILGDFYKIDLSYQNPEFQWQMLSGIKDGHQSVKLKGHTATLFKTNIILFGGERSIGQNSNQIYSYDILNNSWKKIITKNNNIIPKVESHCAVLQGQQLYVYGGYIADQAKYMNDIYALNLNSMQWRKLNNSDEQIYPELRSNCSMVIYNSNLWIFGGTNGKNTLNDMWKYDLKGKNWLKIQSKHTPQARRGHSMIIYKNTIFLFGGIQDVTKQKNDIHIYQIDKNSWSKIHTYTNSIYECSPTLKKSKKEISNKSIDGFSIQRASPLKSSQSGDDLMKKIMAENKHKKFLQKKRQMMKQFNQKHQQYKMKRRISPTTQSMMKSLQSLGNQQDNKNGYKKQIVFDDSHKYILGKKPCARDGQTVCSIISQNGPKMYIFGGDRHLMAFNDLYQFDLDKGLQSLQLYRSK